MIETEIRERLAVLEPSRLEVIDESEQHRGHAGWREGGETHFRIRISAPSFATMSRLARHRAVYEAMGDLTERIHAIAVEADGG
ncbi:MAG: BolA family protein [Paracoccus sp. (in: a-proteobacteria)]|nr:BolA family protein [Paracoccus sp. (in: a-proteobacteria)]